LIIFYKFFAFSILIELQDWNHVLLEGHQSVLELSLPSVLNLVSRSFFFLFCDESFSLCRLVSASVVLWRCSLMVSRSSAMIFSALGQSTNEYFVSKLRERKK